MNRFATYEEENIHYWTHRAPGYSGVNQEELATDQKRVWGRTIQERIAARFPGRKPGSIRVLPGNELRMTGAAETVCEGTTNV